MQPLISAMTSLRKALIAAFKSLLKGKSFLQALLAFWISPAAPKKGEVAGGSPASQNATVRTIEDFLREVEDLILKPMALEALRGFSRALKTQLRERLWSDRACMLPSYNHQLPTGSETGRYLSLDVGGSTLRVALVELRGLEAGGYADSSRIIRISSFRIDAKVRELEGMAFFDWMAARVVETISSAMEEDGQENGIAQKKPIPMGLAWSFPIEQTSLRGGLLQGMGKGLQAANGLLGQDLGDIIKLACSRHSLDVEVSAIINDSSAALLSESYRSPSTRFGLILGTGFNIAVHLPVSSIEMAKYGARPQGWFDRASHVIVNTEMGMFGRDILPMTRWDVNLNAQHPKPDFQPLEHFVSGMYIGELVRLVMIEAVEKTGLLSGVVPVSLLKPYSLETETVAVFESDTTPSLSTAISTFSSRHPSPIPPSTSDILALRTIASLVTSRSAAMVAATLFALWELKAEAEDELLASFDSTSHAFVDETKAELGLGRATVGFNGSVIEQYPGYLENCRKYLQGLVAQTEDESGAENPTGQIDLVPAKESSLLGAAVALACLEEGKAN